MATVPEVLGERHDDTIAGWLSHAINQHWDVETSLPHDTPLERQLILSIVDSDCIKAREAAGSIIEIGHFICHPVELRPDETGEIKQGIRTILIQTNGPPVSFVAKSIITQIQRLGWAEDKRLPFVPPYRRRLKMRNTKGANYIYILQQLKDGE